MMTPARSILRAVEQFFLQYISMPSEYAMTCALWAAMTYIYTELDVLPYLVITSETKRSGKTMLGLDLLRHVSCNPEDLSGLTGSVLYRTLRGDDPDNPVPLTAYMDEAEALASGSTGKLRVALNTGYKKGQTMKVTAKDGSIEEFPVFGPKCFILIGDVYDTLRDRSIVLWMRRASAEQQRGLRRLVQSIAEAEANDLGSQLRETMEEHKAKIIKTYHEIIQDGTLDFLPARDAEIWASLYAICKVLEPSRLPDLQRAAVDLATDKTKEIRSHSAEAMELAEKNATKAEYADKLLLDLQRVMKGQKQLRTEDALNALKDIPTAPWRKFRGVGLTAQDLSDMLDTFGVAPKVIRVGRAGTPKSTARGYTKESVDAAVKRNNL